MTRGAGAAAAVPQQRRVPPHEPLARVRAACAAPLCAACLHLNKVSPSTLRRPGADGLQPAVEPPFPLSFACANIYVWPQTPPKPRARACLSALLLASIAAKDGGMQSKCRGGKGPSYADCVTANASVSMPVVSFQRHCTKAPLITKFE